MKKLVAVLGALIMLLGALPASAAGWNSSVAFTNQVVSSPTTGGGYPVPAGQTAPNPGTCRMGNYNSNRSESWVAVQPGTENLVGASKFFFENYSTFYDFHLGSYTIPNGVPAQNTHIPGYDCISTGTQDMPPSWTNNTDPNVAFDSQGRVYQVTLPFNAFWANMHPNGAIGVVYSDDLGRNWKVGNGGQYLDLLPNSTSLSHGDVVDKQWLAVNAIKGHKNQDHVYAMWTRFDGMTGKIHVAVSRDRGLSFSDAATLTQPQATGPGNTFIIPSIDAAGTVYVSFATFPVNGAATSIYVTRSTDDGVTWGPFVQVVGGLQTIASLPNTRFRDGILENFAASPTYAGHLYVVWENWDGTQMDVMFSQSTDGGNTWSAPAKVNDNIDSPGVPTDQFQPAVAAGPNGAVAVVFYDRRQACPSDNSILSADQGRTNFCINTSLQAYKDSGAGAVAVGSNVRISQFTWDPEQPGQSVGGLSQYPCAGHRDPCPNGRGFIGDYFGLAVSGKNIYALFVSTHYPSTVTADGGGPVYYQQQVLATVPRSNIASGY
ncbi:MAG TPA: sialidase family protein [Anaerolineae bacterium]